MSSPGLTVNDVMEWLQRVRKVALPTLPFSGVWQRFTSLFQRFITSALPSPQSPLPWTIDVGGSWDNVIPGTSLSIESIQIVVTDGTTVSPTLSPSATSQTRMRGKPPVRPAPRERVPSGRTRRSK